MWRSSTAKMLALSRATVPMVGRRSLRPLNSPLVRVARMCSSEEKPKTEETGRRPRPKEADEELLEDEGGTSTTKLAMMGLGAASLGFGYATYDEGHMVVLGYSADTEEPAATTRRLFSLWLTGYAHLTKSVSDSVAWMSNPPKEKLLPPHLHKGNERLLTLVLDLDETLTFTTWSRQKGSQSRRRPYTREFLQRAVNAGAEIVIFSSTVNFITQGIAQALDPRGMFISHILSREHTVFKDGKIIKDLSKLNRDMSRVLIIDNEPETFSEQPHNALQATSWEGDKSDHFLEDIAPFIEHLASNPSLDVRTELAKHGSHTEIAATFRKKTQEKQARQNRLKNLLGSPTMVAKESAAKAKGAKDAKTGAPAASAGTGAQPAEMKTADKKDKPGGVWTWLKKSNDTALMREQQMHEEWQKKQQEGK